MLSYPYHKGVCGMSAKINQYFYPYIGQVKDLPVYLAGIGGTEFQEHISRPDGYCWHQILFSAEGGGTLEFDDMSVKIPDRCFFFLPAYYPHEYYPDDKRWDVRWVVFDGFGCDKLLNELDMKKPSAIIPDSSEEMQGLYNKMFVALKTDKIQGNYTCAGLVYQYILEYHRLASSGSMTEQTCRSEILMPALNFIDDNFRRDFSVSELADISGISQQYLCRIFRRTMNIRPNEYITCRRLLEAKKLLSETDMPINKISSMSGFSDSGYFCTVFKKHENMTPKEYRQLHRKSE